MAASKRKGKADNILLNDINRAVAEGEEKKVQKWLKSGGDVDAIVTTSSGCTLLMTAVAKGRDKIVKMLLANNASVDAQNEDDTAALHIVRRAKKILVTHAILLLLLSPPLPSALSSPHDEYGQGKGWDKRQEKYQST